MTALSNSGDIHVCKNSVFSHFIQIEGMKLIQVDVLPFLMQSQLDGGYDTCWFTKDHLQEVLVLMRPTLESCMETKLDSERKKNDKSKNILTGETVRVAYLVKQHLAHNLWLITHFGSHQNIKNKATSSSKNEPTFQERRLLKEKMVVFVCPRTNSSLLQLSQLVHADVDKRNSQEDISKYFLPT